MRRMIIAAVFFSILAVWTWSLVGTLIRSWQNTDRLAAQNILTDLTVGGRDALRDRDDLGLIEAIRMVRSGTAVQAAFYLSPDGTVLAHTDRTETGKRQEGPVTQQALRDRTGFEVNMTVNGVPTLELAAPVLSGDKLLGLVRVSFPVSSTRQKALWLRLGFAAQVILSLLVLLWASRTEGSSDRRIGNRPPLSGTISVSPSNTIVSVSPALAAEWGGPSPVGRHLLEVFGQEEASGLIDRALSSPGTWSRGTLTLKDRRFEAEAVASVPSGGNETSLILHISSR